MKNFSEMTKDELSEVLRVNFDYPVKESRVNGATTLKMFIFEDTYFYFYKTDNHLKNPLNKVLLCFMGYDLETEELIDISSTLQTNIKNIKDLKDFINFVDFGDLFED